jgi:hypothetical protein
MLYILVSILLFVFPLTYLTIYQALDRYWIVLWSIILGTALIAVLAVIHDVLVRYSGKTPGPRPFLKDWPAVVRKFDVPMTDCVTGISKALAGSHVRTRIFSVVLHDRRHQPHGTIFVTKLYLVRITIWKHWDDPDHTIVHIAPTNTRRRKVIKRFEDIVERAASQSHDCS